jgi:SHS2 domain-containing protein
MLWQPKDEPMLSPHYELFDHTADLGIRAYAAALSALVPPSTEGLYAAIGKVAPGIGGPAWQRDLRGTDPALLLRDYLADVLDLFYCERRRLSDIRVPEFTARRLVVGGRACAIDEAASDLEREVKAVTYHELAIRPIAGGFEATFIVDI